MQKILLVLLTAALFIPNFFEKDLQPLPEYNGKEKFDPSLAGIVSVQQLEQYIDSIAVTNRIATGTYEYAALLNDVIEQRFYHGFSHYSLSENWIAAVAGRFVKEDYSCKVQPAEIMEHTNAACSQQAIVMMQVLRDKNINYRSVGFPHHYALEVQAGNNWYFFDPNMEPDITKLQRSLPAWQHSNDVIKQYYDPSKHADINYQFGKQQSAIVGAVNDIPAQKASVFHLLTAVFSKTGWLFPLIALFVKGGFNVYIPFVSLVLRKKNQLVSIPA